jgi:hypothetical protein
MMSVCRVQILALEVSGCRENDVAVLHAFRHRDIDANTEDLFAREASFHPVLIGMNDNRIVIVNEESTQRRVQVIPLEMLQEHAVDVPADPSGLEG